ncbi:proline-rich protein 2-like [Panthera tigris]|uniref:proline-rich protein 2-like n=1 Tax=Panthera tigris TaxID=9694 RepID=UPI001C6FAED2|nr:proline-rich protein 2-like [Panthera tigris]
MGSSRWCGREWLWAHTQEQAPAQRFPQEPRPTPPPPVVQEEPLLCAAEHTEALRGKGHNGRPPPPRLCGPRPARVPAPRSATTPRRPAGAPPPAPAAPAEGRGRGRPGPGPRRSSASSARPLAARSFGPGQRLEPEPWGGPRPRPSFYLRHPRGAPGGGAGTGSAAPGRRRTAGPGLRPAPPRALPPPPPPGRPLSRPGRAHSPSPRATGHQRLRPRTPAARKRAEPGRSRRLSEEQRAPGSPAPQSSASLPTPHPFAFSAPRAE